MITKFFLVIIGILLINALACFYRIVSGVSILDRMVAINILGTKTLVILVLVAYVYKQSFYLNLAFVYALLNFVVTIAVARYLERGGEEKCLE